MPLKSGRKVLQPSAIPFGSSKKKFAKTADKTALFIFSIRRLKVQGLWKKRESSLKFLAYLRALK